MGRRERGGFQSFRSCSAATAGGRRGQHDVYYVLETPNGSGLVARVPIAGGTPETLASGRTGNLPAVAVDDRNVYWIEGEGTIEEGAVAAVPKSGGVVAVLVSGLSDPSAIAVDGSGIYFDNGGLVEKIPK